MESQKARQRAPSYLAKLHLAVDASTHEVICADLSLNNVTDAEAFPGLIRRTHRKKSGQRRRTVLTIRSDVAAGTASQQKSARSFLPERERGYWSVSMQTAIVLLRINH